MNKLELKDFTRETFSDAEKVLTAGFDSCAAKRTLMFFKNPLYTEYPSAGDIAYKNGEPVVFQAAILRRVNLGRKSYLGVTGSSFCKVPKTGLKFVLALFEKIETPRNGCVMSFGNTSMGNTQNLAGMFGDEFGPESCTRTRFKILRLGSFLSCMLKGRMPSFAVRVLDAVFHTRGHCSLERWAKFDPVVLNAFWARYLETNQGLTLSRTFDDIDWLFGERLEIGSSRCYVHRDEHGVDGYIIFNELFGTKGRRWYVADWVALKNDPRILDILLHEGLIGLAHDTPGAFVDVIGYPQWIQGVLGKRMRFTRKISGNTFTYRFFDEELKKKFEAVKDTSWFFGGLDGDRCIC